MTKVVRHKMTRVRRVRHKMMKAEMVRHTNQRVDRRSSKVVDHKNQMVLRSAIRRTSLVVRHTVSLQEAYEISSVRMAYTP